MPILDFTDYIEDKIVRMETHVDHMANPFLEDGPDDPELFFSRRGFCPFCEQAIATVYARKGPLRTRREAGDGDQDLTVWGCSSCGWWELEYHSRQWDKWPGHLDRYSMLRHAIVRRFDADDVALPIAALCKEIEARPEVLYGIHPRKLEEVVAHVFEAYFDCEVEHCGRSHDGGVDLIVALSDSPVLVQVKRRQSPAAVEPVSSVREFLGAVLLKGQREGIFVTTADHFSKESRQAATTSLNKGLVTKFELIDIKRFLDMFNLVRPGDYEPWRENLSTHEIGIWRSQD